MTNKPLKYIIEKPSPLKQYVFDFICFIFGIKGEKHENNLNQKIDIYYGNNPSQIKKISIIIPESTQDIINPDMINRKLLPKHITKKLNFDFINAISKLITDQINSNLPDDAYDKHDRLCFKHSFQAISNIANIPLVNLYINFLQELIEDKCQLVRLPLWPKGKKCAIGLSHDVDAPDKYSFLRTPFISKSETLKWNIFYTWRKIKGTIKFLLDKKRNNFWLFKNIMDLEEKYGFKSTFFFASVNAFDEYSSNLDVDYCISKEKFRKIFKDILERKFEISLHASYLAYRKAERFLYEKQKLEKIIKVKSIGLRHHYWHMGRNYQKTLKFHESAGFQYDSSIAFNDHIGFRNNIALPYYPWNEENQRPLNVMQLPVFCMDSPLLSQNIEVETAVDTLNQYIATIKAFEGIGVIDWHVRTSYPLNSEFKNWSKCYVNFLECLSKDSSIWVNSLEKINNWLTKGRNRAE